MLRSILGTVPQRRNIHVKFVEGVHQQHASSTLLCLSRLHELDRIDFLWVAVQILAYRAGFVLFSPGRVFGLGQHCCSIRLSWYGVLVAGWHLSTSNQTVWSSAKRIAVGGVSLATGNHECKAWITERGKCKGGPPANKNMVDRYPHGLTRFRGSDAADNNLCLWRASKTPWGLETRMLPMLLDRVLRVNYHKDWLPATGWYVRSFLARWRPLKTDRGHSEHWIGSLDVNWEQVALNTLDLLFLRPFSDTQQSARAFKYSRGRAAAWAAGVEAEGAGAGGSGSRSRACSCARSVLYECRCFA